MLQVTSAPALQERAQSGTSKLVAVRRAPLDGLGEDGEASPAFVAFEWPAWLIWLLWLFIGRIRDGPESRPVPYSSSSDGNRTRNWPSDDGGLKNDCFWSRRRVRLYEDRAS
jgi:hypothetical protein